MTTLQAAETATAAANQPSVGSGVVQATELDEVNVTANTFSTTEGTKSYTTGQARTATPFGISLRETPQSVSVVTNQRLQDQNLDTILDVANHATGVSVNRYETNRAQFNARGFNINRLMVDGVPTIWQQAWSSGEVFSGLAMYDRVEIVRGANGLMTGAGIPSASINMVHKRASSRTFNGSVSLSAGRWDARGMTLDLSTPLNESGSVRARVVGAYNSTDSWVDLLHNQRNLFYATIEADLGDNTLLWLGASRQKNDSDGPMWGGLPVWYADGSRTDWDRSKTTAATWTRWDGAYDNYFASIQHFFSNGWQGTLRYSRGEREGNSWLLYLIGNPAPGMFAMPGSYRTSTIQDDLSVEVSGPFEWFGREHELAFGYSHSQQDFDALQRPATDFPAGIPDIDAYHGQFPEPTWGPLAFYDESQTTQRGLYAVARINPTNQLHLIVGSRFNDYERSGHGQYTAAYTLKPDHEITPYAGVTWDFSRHWSAYASYTSIFQPQSVRNVDGQYLDPVVGNNAELGLKAAFMDGKLNFSAALFQIKQDGLGQATGEFVTGTVNEQAYAASDGATSKGGEIQISGQLAQGWNLTVGYTRFDIEDADGNAINTLYPTQLLRLFTTYQPSGVLQNLTVGGGLSWQNETWTYALNPAGVSERIQQDAFSRLSLMARYQFTPALSTQLNVSNALDEKYFNTFAAYGAITFGAPRNVTATLRYDF